MDQLIVSPKFMRELMRKAEAASKVVFGVTFRQTVDDLVGMKVQESSMLPVMQKTGEIEQLDRFAEYGPDDMWYAEPLGLARWKREECHSIIVRDPGIKLFFKHDYGPVTLEPRGLHHGFAGF